MFKELGGPFDPILAEDFSLKIHGMCERCEEHPVGCRGCPHDIGVVLAQMAHAFYMEEELSVQKYEGCG